MGFKDADKFKDAGQKAENVKAVDGEFGFAINFHGAIFAALNCALVNAEAFCDYVLAADLFSHLTIFLGSHCEIL